MGPHASEPEAFHQGEDAGGHAAGAVEVSGPNPKVKTALRVLRGEDSPIHHPTNILDAQIATKLLRFSKENPVLSLLGFNLLTFDGITDEAASLVAESNLDPLYLNSLRIISPEAARRLAEFQGGYLRLDGLKEFSPDTSTALAGFRGSFMLLKGLTDLAPEVAAGLSRFPGLLALNGIPSISVETATALVAHCGSLILDGLIEFPTGIAEALSMHQGKELSLEGLRFVSDSAGKALAGYRGTLEMAVEGEAVTSPKSSPSCSLAARSPATP